MTDWETIKNNIVLCIKILIFFVLLFYVIKLVRKYRNYKNKTDENTVENKTDKNTLENNKQPNNTENKETESYLEESPSCRYNMMHNNDFSGVSLSSIFKHHNFDLDSNDVVNPSEQYENTNTSSVLESK